MRPAVAPGFWPPLVTSTLGLVILAALVSQADGRVHRVDPQGHGDAPTIQDAIAAAAPGDTILLADGTYTGVKNRDIDFQGKSLTLQSVSGNPDSCIIDCESMGRGFVVYEVPTLRPEASGRMAGYPRIAGLTLTNGHADTGGAVHCSKHCSPTFSNCVFRQNRADENGGAVACSEITAMVRFLDCVFAGNTAGKAGGAIALCCCSEASFENCTIVGNTAQEGSAFSCVGMSCLRMTRSIVAFHGNAPAIQCRGEGSCKAEFTSCDIYGNAGGDWVGCLAALANKDGNLAVDPAFRSVEGSDFRLLETSPLRRQDASARGLGARDE